LERIKVSDTVFTSTDEILAEWHYITPIVEKWGNIKPFVYQKEANPKSLVQ